MPKHFYILFVFWGFCAHAQEEFSPLMKSVYADIFEFKHEQAGGRIDSLSQEGAESWGLAYLHLSRVYVQYMAQDDPAGYEGQRDQMADWCDEMEDEEATSLSYYLIMGDMYMQMSSIEAKYNNTWKSAQYALSALDLLNEGKDAYPESEILKLGTGLLNVAVGSLPDNYKWVASMLGFEGDVSAGLADLEEALEATRSGDYRYLHDKLLFINTYVKFQLNRDESASLTSLGEDPASNPLLAYLEAKILDVQGKNDELIELLIHVQALEDRLSFPHLSYFLGRAKLARGDSDANVALEQFLSEHKGKHFIKSTLRYLHWYYRLQNNLVKSEEYRRRVLTEGDDYVGADLQALREMEGDLLPSGLLRARLGYDAGKFEDALELLDAELYASLQLETDLLEFHYRRGRIFQQLGDELAAIRHFKACTQYQLDPMNFERVNAELQLALLLEVTQPDSAKVHYKQVLSFKDYPWYEGCQQKAKAGLERLED